MHTEISKSSAVKEKAMAPLKSTIKFLGTDS